jgi:presenilin-like A22 family membrane protease
MDSSAVWFFSVLGVLIVICSILTIWYYSDPFRTSTGSDTLDILLLFIQIIGFPGFIIGSIIKNKKLKK